jgi:hypothetical protein
VKALVQKMASARAGCANMLPPTASMMMSKRKKLMRGRATIVDSRTNCMNLL